MIYNQGYETNYCSNICNIFCQISTFIEDPIGWTKYLENQLIKVRKIDFQQLWPVHVKLNK